jgi:hypothetical protein
MGKLDRLKGKHTTAVVHETVSTTKRPSRRPLESVTSTVLNADGVHAVRTESLSIREYPAPALASGPSRPPKELDFLDSDSVGVTAPEMDADEQDLDTSTDASLPTGVRRLHQVSPLLLSAVSWTDLSPRNETFSIDSKRFALCFAASCSRGMRMTESGAPVTAVEEGAERPGVIAAIRAQSLAASASSNPICRISPIGHKSGMKNAVFFDATTLAVCQTVLSSFSSAMKANRVHSSQGRLPLMTPITNGKKRNTASQTTTTTTVATATAATATAARSYTPLRSLSFRPHVASTSTLSTLTVYTARKCNIVVARAGGKS